MGARRSAREIAEELKQLAESSSDHADRLSLLHEVRVYQEELIVQNEELTRTQHALEETRDQFVELYDFAPNGYMTLDPHGVILRINLTGATFIGKPRQAIEGMPLFGFVAAHCRPEFLRFLRRCRATARRLQHDHQHGPDVISEVALRCVDGPRDVQLVCRPRRSPQDDDAFEFFTALIDVTERKRLESEWTKKAHECGALARQLLSIQDRERHRIALDLHDNIGQQLTSLRLMLDVIMMSGLDDTVRQRVTQSLSIVEQLDRHVDLITRELRPAALDLGIGAAIEQFVNEWAVTVGVKLAYNGDGLDGIRLKPDAETHLYRVVQEALHNVAKHAAATRVAVSVEREGSTVLLRIDDDGCGFSLDAQPHLKAGLGLIGMRERAEIAGGSIDIHTAPGKGTKVWLRVPIE